MSFINPYRYAVGGGVAYIAADSDANTVTLSTKSFSLDVVGSSETDKLILAIVATTRNDAKIVSGMTLDGEALTLIDGVISSDGGMACAVAIGYLKDADYPAAGSKTLAVTYTSSVSATVASIIELSGVDQTTPVGTLVTEENITDETGYTYTFGITGSSGEFAVSAVASADPNTPSAQTAPTDTTVAVTDGIDEGLRGVRLSVGYDEEIGSPETFDWVETDGANLDSLVGLAIPIIAA